LVGGIIASGRRVPSSFANQLDELGHPRGNTSQHRTTIVLRSFP